MAKTTMDGTEQTLFESTELGEYGGYVFLDDMEENDVIALRLLVKDVEDSIYKLWNEGIYEDVQAEPTIRFVPIIGKIGIRITARQTAGAYREITHMWFKR